MLLEAAVPLGCVLPAELYASIPSAPPESSEAPPTHLFSFKQDGLNYIVSSLRFRVIPAASPGEGCG